jgi:PAS domain-containing protein
MASLNHNTEFKELSKQLDPYKRQEKLLESVLNASSTGLRIADPNGAIVAWKPAAEAITGLKDTKKTQNYTTEISNHD